MIVACNACANIGQHRTTNNAALSKRFRTKWTSDAEARYIERKLGPNRVLTGLAGSSIRALAKKLRCTKRSASMKEKAEGYDMN